MLRERSRLIVWTIVAALILMIPLAMQFTHEVNITEAIAYSVILLTVGGIYELLKVLKKRSGAYRFAFSVGLAGVFLLFWVNGAIGIIGSENNPANLMYGAVFAVIFIGSLLARLKPRGMARTLFAAAFVQMAVPIFALLVWPAQASWGEAGVIGVFIFNFIFAALFAGSGLLFVRATRTRD